jgi:chromosome segregation ATPase
LEDRLAKLAPDQVDLALKENVEIKVEFQTVQQELKRYKRLLLEAERAIELAKTERDELLEQKTLSAERTSSGLQAEVRKARDEVATKDKSIQNLESELQQLKDHLERVSSKDSPSKIVSSHARNHTRQSISNQSVDDWSNQEHLMEIKNLKNELAEERQQKEELLGDNQDLRYQLTETKNALQDTQDQLEERDNRSHHISRAQSRFQEDPKDYPSSSRKSTAGITNQTMVKEFKREIGDLEKQLRELENENVELRSQVNAQVKMLSTKNSEKDKLQDQVSNLKSKVLDLQDEIEQDAREIEKIQQAGNISLHDQAADEVREVSQAFAIF